MNIVKAFANHLDSSDVAALGHDLFISRAPSSGSLDSNGDPIPENLWWLVAGGGSQDGRYFHIYAINIFYRDRSADQVYEKLQSLGDQVTCAGCLTLEGHEVVGAEVTGLWADQDLDNESRTVGLLQVNVTTYKEC